MRFGYVDNQKRHLVSVLIVEFVEGGDLPPEWRSSVAAKDHNHRLCFIDVGEMNSRGLVQFEQGKVGRGVTDAKGSGAGASP